MGYDYYTFIGQVESGKGTVPPDDIADWAEALRVDPQEFGRRLPCYYQPDYYDVLFKED